MNTNSNQQTLGTAGIPKLLANLAIPAISQLINLLYNMVDRIYIGHIPEIGASAMTGVGLFIPILAFITAFTMPVSSGGAPRASIAIGEQKIALAEKVMAKCFSLLLVFSVVLTIVFYIFAPQLLRLSGASDVTFPYALEYSRIYILGTVFILIVSGMNSFITAQGFAKISMLTSLIGLLFNIVLDPIFIFGLNMGVKGAAFASVISQAFSALWILRFLTGKKH